MTTRTARWLAWSIVAATALLSAGAIALLARSGPPTGVFQVPQATTSPAVATLMGMGLMVFPVVGAIIASRRPNHAIGWLFCAVGLVFAVANFAGTYAYHALDTNPGSLPGGAVVEILLSDGLWLPAIAITTMFLFLFFPSGKLTTRVERITAWTAAAAVVLAGPIGGATSQSLYSAPQIPNPLPTRVPLAVSDVIISIALLSLLACLVSSLVLLIRRFIRSRGEERQQFKWFLFATALLLGTFLPSNFAPHPPEWLQVVSFIALLALPVCVAIAILKYRLFEIDVVIRKTIVYAILVVLMMAIGIGLLLVVTGPLTDRAPDETQAVGILGLALGLMVWPLRRLASTIADRVVFGGRASPYEVLTEFSSRAGEAYEADDVLPRMARVLAEGTGADRASVWLRVGADVREAAAWPDGFAGAAIPDGAVEVRHHGEALGALAVEMPANDPMTASKHKLVEDLAAQAGPVLRNVRLIEELRASRQRLVAAQDEERRKIERNIHDGAQQQLVALAVQLKLAEQLVGTDSDKERELLEKLGSQANSALEDLRDLARGIYPPLLADKGLAAALESQARKAAVTTTVSADEIGRYPQEVESAVYFCALEALSNVAKYANANSATIELSHHDGHLRFEVRDDGDGFDTGARAYGTGLQGMADRLDAIGGSLTVESESGRGTTIAGRVPVRSAG